MSKVEDTTVLENRTHTVSFDDTKSQNSQSSQSIQFNLNAEKFQPPKKDTSLSQLKNSSMDFKPANKNQNNIQDMHQNLPQPQQMNYMNPYTQQYQPNFNQMSYQMPIPFQPLNPQFQSQYQPQQQIQQQQQQIPMEKQDEKSEKTGSNFNQNSKEFTKPKTIAQPFYTQQQQNTTQPLYQSNQMMQTTVFYPPSFIPNQNFQPSQQQPMLQKQPTIQMNVQAESFKPTIVLNQQKEKQVSPKSTNTAKKNTDENLIEEYFAQFKPPKDFKETYKREDFTVKNKEIIPILKPIQSSAPRKVSSQTSPEVKNIKEIPKINEEKTAIQEVKIIKDIKIQEAETKLEQKDDVQKQETQEKPKQNQEKPSMISIIEQIKVDGILSAESLLNLKEISLQMDSKKQVWPYVTSRTLSSKYLDRKQGGFQNKNNSKFQKNKSYNNQQDQQFKTGVNKPAEVKEENSDPIFRQEIDKEKEKLQKQAKDTLSKIKQEKNIFQKIRLICNQISPDSFDKKFDELVKYLFTGIKELEINGQGMKTSKGVITLSEFLISKEVDLTQKYTPEEVEKMMDVQNLQIVIESIFKRAQNEKTYCKFYGDLVEKLIRMETSLKSQNMTLRYIKLSLLRKTLLTYCKASFDQFFNHPIYEKIKLQEQKKTKDPDLDEEYMKFKHRLMCNIKFVGELNTRALLEDQIMIQIFSSLMMTNQNINDDTVEGAVVLMSKLGAKIDEKIKKIKSISQEEIQKDKKLSQYKQYQGFYDRFEELSSEENKEVSLRIKMLIKNMFKHREDNWQKVIKEDEAPKTIEQLRKIEQDKLQQVEERKRYEDDDYYNQSRQYDNDRRSKKGSKNQQYQNKGKTNDRVMNKPKNYYNEDYVDRDRSKKGSTYVKKQSSTFQAPEKSYDYISDDQLAKLIVQIFTEYVNQTDEADKKGELQKFQDLQQRYGKKGDELILLFLNHIFDLPLSQLETNYTQFLKDLIATFQFSSQDYGKALTAYMPMYQDLLLDCPILPGFISKTIFMLLETGNLYPDDFNLSKLIENFIKDNDGIVEMAMDFFELVQSISKLFTENMKSSPKSFLSVYIWLSQFGKSSLSEDVAQQVEEALLQYKALQ